MNWNKTAVAAAFAIGIAQQVAAQTVTEYDFNISSGPRGAVLQEIARVAGSAVSITDPNAPGLAELVQPVHGKLTLADALKQALAGSDWYVIAAGNGEVRIGRYESTTVVVVTGRRPSLRKEDSSLLTRSDTPLQETPGTVESVSHEVLESQNVTNLAEALRNLPGISIDPGPPLMVSARAGNTGGQTFSNGLRNSQYGGNAPTIDVAAIEMLKGPSSILSGTAVAGGLVNLVPKEATGTSASEFDLGVGSKGYVRGSVDVGGDISEENRLYWRFVGLAEHANEQNGGGADPSSKAATFMFGYRDKGWKIDTQTQYYDTRAAFTRLYRNDDDTRSIIPIDAFYNPDAYYRDESLSQSVQLEKGLYASQMLDLRFRTRARFQHAIESLTQLQCGGTCGGDFIPLFNVAYRGRSNQISSSTDLYAKLTTGEIEQQLIVAFDYAKGKGQSLGVQDYVPYPFEPIPPLRSIPNSATPDAALTDDHQKDYGVVIQDQLNWGRAHGLLSLRKSWYDEVSKDEPNGFSSNTAAVALLPSGGVVFDVKKWASIYYSYQKGLTPPMAGAKQADGSLIPPSITTGHEAGIKLELFDNRLSVNADYFRSAATNYPIATSNPLIYIAGPGQKVDGFEVSEVGNLTPTLFLQSGFTYTRPTSSTPVVATPTFTTNVHLLKTFKLEDSAKIDAGFGANYQSAPRVALLDPTFTFNTYPRLYAHYLRFDASIGYARAGYRLNLTIDNIFDRFNLYNPSDALNLRRGTGRDVRLVLTVPLPEGK